MARFIFGLNAYNTKPDHKSLILKAIKDNKLDDIVKHLVSKSGGYILPILNGRPENLAVVRQRYFDLLNKIFSEDELEYSLKVELETIIKEPESESLELAIQGSSINWKDWLPDWFWNWWNNGEAEDGNGDNGENDEWPPPGEPPTDIELPTFCCVIHSDGYVEGWFHEEGEGPNLS